MRFPRVIVSIMILLAGAAGIFFWWQNTKPTLVEGQLISQQAAPTGFSRAEGVIPLTFPETFGPHPDFQTEWWYYTGNLDTPEGRHFGYQLTFFRRAVLPSGQRSE